MSAAGPSGLRLVGKIESLRELEGFLPAGSVPVGIAISRPSFDVDRSGVLTKVLDGLDGEGPLVVRSSAAEEDRSGGAEAGRYISVIGVEPEEGALAEAIEAVFESMARGGGGDRDMVLVQRLVVPLVSAVVFTREPTSGAPYLILATQEGPTPEAVTAGGAVGQLAILHGHEDAVEDESVRAIAQLSRTVVAVTDAVGLDLEIVVDHARRPRLIQARRLQSCPGSDPEGFGRVLEAAQQHLALLASERRDGLLGRGVALSDMADWNPAEIIGAAPRPLAYALYETLVGSRAWWQARAALGYREVPIQLFHRLGAHPYVHVGASLSSLVPAAVPDGAAGRLVTAGLVALREDLTLHTRLEFELSCSCVGLDQNGVPDALVPLLSPADSRLFAAAAASMTRKLIGAAGRLSPAALAQRFAAEPELQEAGLAQRLERAVDRGAAPFAAAARHAFAAERLLTGLVKREALSVGRAEALRGSVATISTRCSRELRAVRDGRLDADAFMSRYGHLRPGTYDIGSWRYQDLDLSDLIAGSIVAPPEQPHFEVSVKEKAAIEKLCLGAGLDLRAEVLLDYVVAAIALREEGKFRFSWYVSEILEAIAGRAELAGLGREDAAMLELVDLLDPRAADTGWLTATAESGRRRHEARSTLLSPPVALGVEDLEVLASPQGQPTFITAARVAGPVEVVDDSSHPSRDLSGSIVCAERLDPGFEWLFSRPIAGLVVRFSGPNSHVAVRCHELGIPAALGCAPHLFAAVRRASRVEMDCQGRTLKTV